MPIPKAEDGLTDKQRAFVGFYLKTLNATQSAIKAGYSKRTAGFIGYENLQKPQIKAALTLAKAKRANVEDITRSRILEEYTHAAFAEVEAPVAWSDKRAALRDLGQAIGLFEEKGPAVTVNVSMNDANSVARELAGRIAGIASRVGAGSVPSQSDAGGERGTPLELAPLLGKTKPDSSAG